MRQIPFLDLKPMHSPLETEFRLAFEEVLSTSNYICGPHLKAFETEFAAYSDVSHCVGLSNGLDALTLSLRALGVGPGDEVIVPANTFIATALAVTAVGAKPVLVDVDEKTFNLDPALVEMKLNSKTRAIIGVHLYGLMADVDRLEEIAKARKLFFIEDAAQAHGATWNGRKAGSVGDIAAFSFYPGKNLGALGDGGAITTKNQAWATRIESLRSYGSPKKYHHVEKGVNARLDELQAAFLRVKLRQLPDWDNQRQRLASYYSANLKTNGLILPSVPDGACSAWHLYVVRSTSRDEVQRLLSSHGVQTLIHYPVPIHLQEAYQDLGYRRGDFPVSELLSQEILSLPLWIGMPIEQAVDQINDAIAELK